MKRTIAGILLLAVGACLLMIAVSFAGSAELDPYHINFKSGDALLAETDSDLNAAGNSLHVEAQYDPPLFPGGSRSNKDWVEVNNWSSEDRAFLPYLYI